MTKSDFADLIHERLGLSKKSSMEIVEIFFEILKETLETGEEVKIARFGNFEVKHKNARRGRNPQTDEELEIAARKVLRFRPSLLLKKALNE